MKILSPKLLLSFPPLPTLAAGQARWVAVPPGSAAQPTVAPSPLFFFSPVRRAAINVYRNLMPATPLLPVDGILPEKDLLSLTEPYGRAVCPHHPGNDPFPAQFKGAPLLGTGGKARAPAGAPCRERTTQMSRSPFFFFFQVNIL